MDAIKRSIKKLKNSIYPRRDDPAVNVDCSEFEVNNWHISNFIIEKLVPVAGTHPYPIAELNLMTAAVCRLKPQQIFEWGTNIGKSARIFHEVGKYFRIPMHIYSIDLPDDIEHGEHPRSRRGNMVKGLSDVTLYQADGLEKSIEIYKKNPQDRTLVFIDGDHSYASVCRELSGIISEMPNASILLHDTFYQSEGSGYNVGPYKAITDTLVTCSEKYKLMSTNLGLPGMTLLYRADSI